jgi:hypothetical protein
VHPEDGLGLQLPAYDLLRFQPGLIALAGMMEFRGGELGAGSMEGRGRQVDIEQLAAFRRLQAAFGFVQVFAIRADDQGTGGQAGTQGMLEGGEDGPAPDDPGTARGGG